MLKNLLDNHWLLYSIAAATTLGVLGLLIVNSFYEKVIRDTGRIDEPKGKWMKSFLKNYQLRLTKNQKIQNAEAFIRTQLLAGKSLGVFVYRLKRWTGYLSFVSFLIMAVAIFGTYRHGFTDLVRYQYLLAGVGSLSLTLLFRQFLGFSNKEDMILDSLTDHMENSTRQESKLDKQASAAANRNKEQMIAQVTEGIKQTAASGNKFSHLLTPEEEDIMRDVIKEYLT